MKNLVAFGVVLLAAVALVGAANPNIEIQQTLKDAGYYQGEVDGIMGPGTQNAIRMFQVDNELEPDGIAGEKTLKVLGVENSPFPKGGDTQVAERETEMGISKTPDETFAADAVVPRSAKAALLAKFIQAEVGDQPYDVQVAVGAVALNRLAHENFPNTLAGVIFQSDAFIAVRDGRMNAAPTEEAVQAAAAALAGEDPTEGCLYYYDPGPESRKYVLERQPKTSIGRYRFCI